MSDEYYYDPKAAQLAVRFFDRVLRHSKGEWAGRPFRLDTWQREGIIEPLFGRMRADQSRQYRRAYIEIPRKNGKALDVLTEIPTPDGWKRHGELKPGDLVFGPGGKPCSVLAVTTSYRGPCYKLTFSDRTTIIAHAQHEWMTRRSWYTKRSRGSRKSLPMVTTEDIANTLRTTGRGDLVHGILVTAALELPEMQLEIDPYVLGVWLGDGASSSARLTCADIEILDELNRRGYPVEQKSVKTLYLIGRGRFQKQLRKLELLGNKHIPDNYLRASYSQRLDLLRGLMDTDGYVSKVGQCELVLTNIRLFMGAVELIRSLGHKTTTKIDRATLNGRDCGPRYRAQFWAHTDEPVVLLPRKTQRLKVRSTGHTRNQTLMVMSAEPVGNRTVNCIEVEGGMYLAGPGMIPTHNSTLSAGIGLYLLTMDGEPGAEVYSAAADRDQAAIVFEQARSMVENAPLLSQMCKAYRREIVVPSTESRYRVLSADVKTKHGFNASGIIFDELHTQPNRDLWDVLNTSTGARRQPLMVMITTAGYDLETICGEQHEYARQILEGAIEDPSFFAYIMAASKDDDWTDPSVWAKANPGLGVSVKLDYLQEECKRALNSPTYQNTFRRLHLNQWTAQAERWISMEHWNACASKLPDLTRRPCFAALDLSSTTDTTALVLAFGPQREGEPVWLMPFFWLPGADLRDRENRDRAPYSTWAREGLITLTEGNVIDYGYVKQQVADLGKQYRIQQIAYDPWNSTQVALDLESMGFEMVQMRQGFGSLSAPSKEFERLVLAHQLGHDGHKVLRWMADNVSVVRDPAGNIKPDKRRRHARIDGIVASIMALDLVTRHKPVISIYERQGVREL